ncbi:MAG: T9SS type A sorting domain-containing protein, partial [bacterium]|nr:T9SS type A sorting domain-containing protein [bacterium]
GCSATTTITRTQPSMLVASSSAGNILCNGGSTAVSVTATGGTGAYTGIGVFSITAGSYTYAVTDANSCSATTSITRSQPSVLVASSTAGNILCNGGSTTVSVTAIGGTGAYTGTGVFTISAGSYTYFVTDANACSAGTTVTRTQPTSLLASITAGTILCNGGTTTVNVSATGGSGSYSGTEVFTVSAGSHTFVVNDANECAANVTITISQPSLLIASSSAGNILCNGGSTTVSVTATGGTGAYTGTGVFSITAGSYTYVVTDANGCSATTTITRTQPSMLVANSTAGNILCNGGSTTVSVTATGGTGAYTGTGVFTISAGTYTYVVTDANGCSASTTVTRTQPTSLLASITAGTILCNGGTTTVNVSATGGSGSYSGTEVFTVSAGSHTFLVNDANECAANVTITISQPSLLIASSTAGTILCNGGSTTVSVAATGGTGVYSGTGVYTVSAGSYTYAVTDANGCSASTSISRTQPALLVANSSAGSILCNGGSTTATVSASGGVGPYNATGNYTVSVGSHSYIVTDVNGCTASTGFTLTQPAALSMTVTKGNILCFGGTTTASVIASGGTGLYNGTGVFTVSAGPRTFTISDANTCSTSSLILVTQPALFALSFASDSILCNGGSASATVTPSGGTSPYSGNIGVFPVSAGPNLFMALDAHGCSAMVVGTLAEPQALSISAASNEIKCHGDTATVTISAMGGTAPYIGTGSYSVTAGTYSYVVTDTNGCANSLVITMLEPSPLVASSIISSILCHGDSATAIVIASGGTGPYLTQVNDSMPCMNDYLRGLLAANGGTVPYWGPGTYQVPAGTYTYGVVDANCCWDTAQVTITEPPQLVAGVLGGVILCGESTTTVSVSGSGGTTPYSGVSIYTVGAGTYSYQVTDANGCSDTLNIRVDSTLCLGFDTRTLKGNCSALIYPNPNNGSFKVFSCYGGDAFIVNQTGQRIMDLVLSEEQELNVDNLQDGVYYLITARERIKVVIIYDK